MEGDQTNNVSSDGPSEGLQKMRPLHGRTSGPTRRSTKGQWTAEEDEILCKAVQRFKGKNWKKIAECFKDRTDVQCLHRWQKVLNPELVKGPWSKEEDEVIIQLVNEFGAKKWSTIASHLPGRIGKQCRERWHNHLNPAINKDAWTQEEELQLIRAHQIYGNKWAELTKFLPGRTDNSIKNHWNSSVKKKLDSYLASGLLAQFQSLPHAPHTNQSTPSTSSRTQQCSGDECLPKNGVEAEEISECSQGSTFVAQSANDVANAMIHMREECQLAEEPISVKESSSSPMSCCENYLAAVQEAAFPIEEVPYEMDSSSKFVEYGFSHDWLVSSSKDWQVASNELHNLSSLDPGHESSGLYNCVDANQIHESFPIQTCMDVSASTSTGNMAIGSDMTGHLLIAEDDCPRMIYPEEGSNTQYNPEHQYMCSNSNEVDGSQVYLVYQSSNGQMPHHVNVTTESFYSVGPDMLGTSCCQSICITQLPPDEGTSNSQGEPDQCDGLLLGNQEELLTFTHDGFLYTNDSGRSDLCDGQDYVAQDEPQAQEQTEQANYSSELVPTDAFCSKQSNDIQRYPSGAEKHVQPSDQEEEGALSYEPPRFPSLDIPFFSCDLVQPCSDNMQYEYSPLGIRQLMMSSMNCFSPQRLWNSPSRDDSPEAVLKSAAKTFTGTPSILKKRNRDLLSPLSEKRCEKKLESVSFSNLAKDFSRLEVLFDDKENQQPRPSFPSLSHKGATGAITEDKENLSQADEEGKKEGKESKTSSALEKEFDRSNSWFGIEQGTGGSNARTNDDIAAAADEKGKKEGKESKISSSPEKEFDRSNSVFGIEQGAGGSDARTKDDIASAAETVQQPLGVLTEQNLNDLLFFSPDKFGNKSETPKAPSARAVGNLIHKKLEPASDQGAVSEVSSQNQLPSFVSPRTVYGTKLGGSRFAASMQPATSSAPLETMAEKSMDDMLVENFGIFGETPFKRSIESPSAWKSPWFINSFIPGPRVDTDITIEDIGYFMSPGERSLDALGLMKELSQHTAATYVNAKEVLGDETPDTIIKRISRNEEDANNIRKQKSQQENSPVPSSSILTERRVLDFSDCGTPGKKTDSGKFSNSYLLKGCR